MSGQVQSSLPLLVFALLVAALLFGVFFNRAVKESLRAWWRGLDSRTIGEVMDPEVLPKREPEILEVEPGSPHAKRPYPEKREAHARRSPPHVEKKEAPLHRNG